MSALTLAVAALPEEFPVVFTFFLGVGVYRLARRQALVRRAVAVENIGRVTCICSDKTGTITEGRAAARPSCLPADGTSSRACSSSPRSRRARESGDPLDEAILRALRGARNPGRRRTRSSPPSRSPRTAGARPSSSARRTARLLAVTKGAPETRARAVRARRRRARALGRARGRALASERPQGDRVRVARARPTALGGRRARPRLPLRRPARVRGPGARGRRRRGRAVPRGRHPRRHGDRRSSARRRARSRARSASAATTPRVVAGDELDALLAEPDRGAARAASTSSRARLPGAEARARAGAAGGRRDRRGDRRRRERRAGAAGRRRRHRDGRARRRAARARSRRSCCSTTTSARIVGRSPRAGSSSATCGCSFQLPADDPHPARRDRGADPARGLSRCSTCRSTSSGSSS